MAYTFDVQGLVDYVNEFKSELISRPLSIGNSSMEWDILTGNKDKANINYAEESLTLQCGDGCDFNPEGSTVFSKKEVQVIPFFLHQKLCYEQLDAKYLSAFSNVGQSDENSKLVGEYFDRKINLVAQQIEIGYWYGNPTHSCEINGIINQLSTDSDREEMTAWIGVTISSTNVVQFVEEACLAFPKEIKLMDNLRLYVSDDIYSMFILALIKSGQYFVEFGDIERQMYRILGTKIWIKAVPEFTSQLLIGTYATNFQKHTDMENEYENLVIEPIPNSNAMAIRAAWKYGIGIKYPEYVVTNF